MKLVSGLCLVCVAACGSDAISVPPPGEIIGHVELAPDVPAGGCFVLLEGVPIGGPCDQEGGFDLRNVPEGRWVMRILPDENQTLPSRRLAVGANSGFVSDLGALQLSAPGSVGGHVKADDATLTVSFVAVPDIGSVTVPNAGGGYLLDAVAAGARDIVLIGPTGSVTKQSVNVLPQKTTIDVNFDISQATSTTYAVAGHASRVDGSTSGLRVELVNALDGTVVVGANPAGDGGFSLTANPGAYVVRATDPGNPARALIPSVIVGDGDVTLASPLVIPQAHGDLDGDGIPDDRDDDIDGDGHPNSVDAFPYDPAEYLDTDGDGLGDRADLSSHGTNVDHQTPTPDTDGDGKLDFEDNCPTIPNADQADADHDGIGDACDTCPLVPNPDQSGLCVQCITNDQCGNEVCEGNHCVACTSTTQCSSGKTCDTAIGECLACVLDADCGAAHACLDGVCVAACMNNTQCSGAFCVGGKCEQCRSPADCPQNQYCDVGTCRPQCSTSGDCTNGRICDVPTGTCVQACGTGCPTGDTCVAGVCHQYCDSSHVCPTGQDCGAMGVCKPQCAVTADCAGTPHTLCNSGACVPDGSCTFDADCPVTEMCVAGACLARTTTFDPGFGYECTSACDCRQGETCDATAHCANDVVQFGDGTNGGLAPTFFAQAGASGNGASPATPGDPAAGLALAAAGNHTVLALRGGDTISISGPVTLAEGDVEISGGYHVCAANRWVRDRTMRTTITTANSGVVAIPGNLGQLFPHVAIRGLAMTTTDPMFNHRRVFVDAAYAPSLVVTDTNITPTLPGGDLGAFYYAGIACDHCNTITLRDVSIAGASAPTATSAFYRGVALLTGSGTFTNVTVGGIVNIEVLVGIEVQNTTGPVTIDGAQIGQSASNQGYGIRTTCGADALGVAYPLTISNSEVGWNTDSTNGGNAWAGVGLDSCRTAIVHDVVVDGTGMTDASGANRIGYLLNDCSGTFTNDGVIMPSVTGAGVTEGFSIAGPHGAIALSKPAVGGASGNGNVTMLDVHNVSQGVVAVTNGTFTSASGSSVQGIEVTNSDSGGSPAVTVVDSTIKALGGTANSFGLYATGARVRVERSTIIAQGGNDYAVTATGVSTVELYDSFAFADATVTGGNAVAASISGTSQLFAVGDTLDGNGSLNSNITAGIDCTSDSQVNVSSSLISGGLGSHRIMLYDAGTSAGCFVPARFDHDYFWFARSGAEDGTEDVGSVVSTAVGTFDARGNVVEDNLSCYDTAFSAPNYHISATSACIDKGAAGTRRDGSAITLDLTSATRTLGAAADIGCFEKK